MLEDLMHWLVEEGYDFTVRSPAEGVATVYVPTDDVNIHALSTWCREHELSMSINHAEKEFIILVRRGQ
jgi:hypothetical protein